MCKLCVFNAIKVRIGMEKRLSKALACFLSITVTNHQQHCCGPPQWQNWFIPNYYRLFSINLKSAINGRRLCRSLFFSFWVLRIRVSDFISNHFNPTMVTLTNAHDDLVHDAVLDYYGRKLASCSADKTIKIFNCDAPTASAAADDDSNAAAPQLEATLVGHNGPVWQLAWAHPKFGTVLASCSYDGKVIIWKKQSQQLQGQQQQQQQGQLIGQGIAGQVGQAGWTNIIEYSGHNASVNSIQWCNESHGAQLVCSSSDGMVSILKFQDDGSLKSTKFKAHDIGVNCAVWGPNCDEIVTGGCDNLVKIWSLKKEGEEDQWILKDTLLGHTDWVRDVAWSGNILSKSYIATASQDRTVLIWSKEIDSNEWKKQLLSKDKFPDVCWRVSWSLSGNVLAVSGGDNKITLWKETVNGDWELAGEVSN